MHTHIQSVEKVKSADDAEKERLRKEYEFRTHIYACMYVCVYIYTCICTRRLWRRSRVLMMQRKSA